MRHFFAFPADDALLLKDSATQEKQVNTKLISLEGYIL